MELTLINNVILCYFEHSEFLMNLMIHSSHGKTDNRLSKGEREHF